MVGKRMQRVGSFMSWAAWLWLAALQWLISAEASYSKLRNVRTDQGTWDHVFAPQRSAYKVALPSSAVSVTVSADIDFSRYSSAIQWPIIRFNGSRIDYGAGQSAIHTYVLPSTPYGVNLSVDILSAEPPKPKYNGTSTTSAPFTTTTAPLSKTVYHVFLTRPPDFQRILALTQMMVTDMRGQPIQMQPSFVASMAPVSKYLVYVAQDTRQVNLTAACDPRAAVQVDASGVVAGTPVFVPMDSGSTSTRTRVICTYKGRRSAFNLEFRSRVQLESIKLSLHVLGSLGDDVTHPSSSQFLVSARTSPVEIVPFYNDTRVGLDLLTISGQKYKLGNYIPSPPLDVPTNGTRSMYLVLHNRGQSRRFDLVLRRYLPPVSTTTTPPPRQPNAGATFCGYMVTVTIGICILTASLIRGVCEAFGLGTPRFASPALRSLLFLLQFVGLSSAVLESCLFVDFARPLRWLSLCPPRDPFWQYITRGANTWLGRWLFRVSADGDTAIDISDAVISLTSVGATVGLVLGLHILVLARLLVGGCCSRRYTLPHRLVLGGWESRCLLLLAFPACSASVVLLLSIAQSPPSIGSTVLWSVCAVCALTISVALILVTECAVRHALSRRMVTWVFEGGTRVASDASHDEAGYFCDATCDQLGTMPAERSYCASFISHCWGTTVADIQPIELEQTLTERLASARLLSAKDDLEDVAADADGTADVEVVATLRPGALCQPFYCEVGRCCNVPWLKAQLDAPALLRLHQEVDVKLNDFATPLRVSVSQLQGPVTSGWLSFCFDGLHWPHLPPLEFVGRLLLGVLTAVAITRPSLRALALFVESIIASGLFIFMFFHTPCTSITENALLLLAYLGLALVAFELAVYAAGIFSLGVCSWAATITVFVVVVPLLAYAILASLSLFLAATCPRVSEQELESHRANNVDLALRGPHDAWLMILPASCTVPVTDTFVHTREKPGGSAQVFVTENVGKGRGARPRLEFSVLDYLAPIDQLEVPRVVLIGPSQGADGLAGYRSETIYRDEDPNAILAEFLRRSSLPTEYTPGVTREVLDLLRRSAGPGKILVVDLMEPPRDRRFDAEDDALDIDGSDCSDEERESLMGTMRVRDLRKVAYDN